MNSIWYTYKPADTILVRGADDDSSSAFSVFPPPASTIIGAIRTLYLQKHGIDFNEYKNNQAPQNVYEAIGKASENPSFELLGPLFAKGTEIFIPAPAGWFYHDNSKKMDHHNGIKVTKEHIIRIKQIGREDLPGISSSKEINVWPEKYTDNMEPMAGKFLSLADILNYEQISEISLYNPDYFYHKEPHVGVALFDDRRTREGKLYSFTHYRLNDAVTILFGLTEDLGLGDEGILKIGAEQRFGKYTRFESPLLSALDSNRAHMFLSLSYNACTDEKKDMVLAFDKIVYFGGWDLAKGFHKPMTAYFPPGSLFKEKITNTIGLPF